MTNDAHKLNIGVSQSHHGQSDQVSTSDSFDLKGIFSELHFCVQVASSHKLLFTAHHFAFLELYGTGVFLRVTHCFAVTSYA